MKRIHTVDANKKKAKKPRKSGEKLTLVTVARKAARHKGLTAGYGEGLLVRNMEWIHKMNEKKGFNK